MLLFMASDIRYINIRDNWSTYDQARTLFFIQLVIRQKRLNCLFPYIPVKVTSHDPHDVSNNMQLYGKRFHVMSSSCWYMKFRKRAYDLAPLHHGWTHMRDKPLRFPWHRLWKLLTCWLILAAYIKPLGAHCWSRWPIFTWFVRPKNNSNWNKDYLIRSDIFHYIRGLCVFCN